MRDLPLTAWKRTIRVSSALPPISRLYSSTFFLIPLVVSGFFFFSSRRRHTRCLSDWSSDVCSSDLAVGVREHAAGVERRSAPVVEVLERDHRSVGAEAERIPGEAVPARDVAHAEAAGQDRKSVV